jgi:hypothetical protein
MVRRALTEAGGLTGPLVRVEEYVRVRPDTAAVAIETDFFERY